MANRSGNSPISRVAEQLDAAQDGDEFGQVLTELFAALQKAQPHVRQPKHNRSRGGRRRTTPRPLATQMPMHRNATRHRGV